MIRAPAVVKKWTETQQANRIDRVTKPLTQTEPSWPPTTSKSCSRSRSDRSKGTRKRIEQRRAWKRWHLRNTQRCSSWSHSIASSSTTSCTEATCKQSWRPRLSLEPRLARPTWSNGSWEWGLREQTGRNSSRPVMPYVSVAWSGFSKLGTRLSCKGRWSTFRCRHRRTSMAKGSWRRPSVH